MKLIKSILFTLVSLAGLTPAQAAITTNVECVDSKGLSVYWESQLGTMDEDGEITGEVLYRGRVQVSAKNLEIDFTPDQSLTSGEPALLAAWTNDGQYIVINARRRHQSGPDGEPTYTGTMELRLKSKKGLLKRPATTTVRCSISGEA